MRRLTLFLFFCNTILSAVAQPAEAPRVRNWPPEAYGGQNQNWRIVQSPDGLIHTANSAGLLSGNGSEWRLRPLPNGQIARAVCADRAGRLYVGGYGEFGYWEHDPVTGAERYTSLSRGLPAADLNEEIWHIVFSGERVIFQSFGYIFTYDGKKVRRVRPPAIILFMQPWGDDLIVPALNQGLYRYDGDTTFTLLPGTEPLGRTQVRGLLPTDDGALLIATDRQGFFTWRDGRLRPRPTAVDAALREQQINRVLQLADERLAVGTILGGLYLLTPGGQLDLHLDQRSGLQNNTVLALYQDRRGDLWVGLDRGLDLVLLSDPVRYGGQGLGAVYASIVHAGYLYIGTNRGLFRRPWGTGGDFSLVPGSQGQVWELREVDGLLLCGHNNGTFFVERDGLRQISPITGGWRTLSVPGRPDRLLQATYTGIILLERDAAGQWRYTRRLPGLLAPIKRLAWGSRGELLAIHVNRGLFRLWPDPGLDTLHRIDTLGPADGLTSEFFLSPTLFAEGLVLQSTDRGYVYKNGRLQPLGAWRGRTLTPGARLAVLPGDGWLEAMPDHVRIHHAGGRTDELDLRLSPDYPNPTALPNGAILLGLDEGYALFDTTILASEPLPPEPGPSFHGVQIILRDTSYWIYPQTGREISLRARQNHLRFHFRQPVFHRSPYFACRLTGFDARFSEWSTRNEREYTNLPPGDYRFELRAEGSRNHAVLYLSIAAPWYLTVYAYVAYFLLLLGLLHLANRYHHYRLARVRRRLEIERERQLQQERIRLRNEQLQADFIRKSKELANSTFSLVRKNEILLELKDELAHLKTSNGGGARETERLRHLIDKHLSHGGEEAVFEANLQDVHDSFFKKLKTEFPDLTPGDLRLAAYLKMNLTTKEIAPLLRISVRGVENKRYRLRRKLGLEGEEGLTDFLLRY